MHFSARHGNEERTVGSATSTKQHLWCDADWIDERDAFGSLTREFFGLAQLNISVSATNYLYSLDHIKSVREMTNSAGVIQAQYYYSPFGESTKISGLEESDFRFAGYFIHQRSKLCKPIYRLYSPLLGRFINRDPISERGGVNLFAYVANSPTQLTDPIGFMPKDEGQFYKQGFDFREFNYGEWGGQGLANGGHPIGGELGKFPHEGQKG